jgi:drug/metabolite transporter (DMT)-like permease
MTPQAKKMQLQIAAAFAMVYIFWGSTYLGIRIAVEEMPPFVMGGVRFLISGILMLAFCAARGWKVRINSRDALRLAGIGVLLLTGGNMGVAYAEQHIPSGLASLIVAVVPIWVALVEGVVLRIGKLNARGWAGLTVGIFGLAVLLWPKLNASSSTLGRVELAASIVLIFASLSWSCGSIASRHWKVDVSPITATGWEMTFAGAVNLLLATSLGNFHGFHMSTRGMAAVLYLVVFGSWVGFTAYIWLLEHVPTAKVATYAYVNPIVAVFLGWLVAHESVDRYVVAGSVFIIAGVALITTAKVQDNRSQLAPAVKLSQCEAEA